MILSFLRLSALLLAVFSVSACGGRASNGSAADELSRTVFTRMDNEDGIGVNSYLWSASLQTLQDFPLSMADSTGGVILTDWTSSPDLAGERFKIRVTILDTRLRSDALTVTLHKEVYDRGMGWITAAADPESETKIENAILTRARELRTSILDD